MATATPTWNARGSAWHRWDPHIHAPGTIHNDLFGSDWEGYIKTINESNPPIRALGITDYYSLEAYREVRRLQAAGKLPTIALVFPNIEMRFDVKTARGSGINVHLLFSPDDPEHETKIERILSQLTFEYKETTYPCNTSGLIGLGRHHDPKLTDDKTAYAEGAKQFKAGLNELRKLFRSDEWLRENCLVAISAAEGDGTSGLKGDDAFEALREEMQRFSDIIFSGKPCDRDYWLGDKAGEGREAIEKKYHGLKPCLHGSDAHEIRRVGKPDLNRYCWIKGDLSFETLRQTMLEPADRVWIGERGPAPATPSETLDQVRPINTPWLTNTTIPLNPGLVAVIGARGSGKTALVDLIAAGGNALVAPLADSSFLKRAFPLMADAKVELSWCNGATFTEDFRPPPDIVFDDLPASVCYLSQHSVERLCSADGLAQELRTEIERVIFQQTDQTRRMGADSFDSLAETKLGPVRRRRAQQIESVKNCSQQIAEEQRLIDGFAKLTGDRDALVAKIKTQKNERDELIPKGKEVRAARLSLVETSYAAVESKIEEMRKQLTTLDNLLAEANYLVSDEEPRRFAAMQEQFAESGLTAVQWEMFRMKFAGDYSAVIAQAKRVIAEQSKLKETGNPAQPIDVTGAVTNDWPLATLKSEREKLKKEVGVDAERQKKYEAQNKVIVANEALLKKLEAAIKTSEGAEERRGLRVQSRKLAYRAVFDTFVEEQAILAELYAPLHAELAVATGALGRLRFSARRHIDLGQWIKAGEALLDLRISTRFRGHGALSAEATTTLLPAWQAGDPEKVATAMHEFVSDAMQDLKLARPNTVTAEERPEWFRSVGDWLYSTDHITIEYGLEYDGTNVMQLSPGTRGIVLLLLYLAIDRSDQRPLLIDQPEENLDPKSVFLDLVPHFREACKRRQVIIVTHNANLVVNTDADQVIVATATPASAGSLPNITYTSGSLENPQIRNTVCDILEGGKRAFLERERRYRLRWEQIWEDTPVGARVHFGYGSNLGKAQMKKRCPHHTELGRATLDGYRWIINKRGYANIVVSPGDVVEGFLYELTTSDETRLDDSEGVAKGSYAKHYPEVKFGDKVVTALTYIDPITEEGVAAPEYVERINLGVADAKLPAGYVEKYIRKFIKAPAGTPM